MDYQEPFIYTPVLNQDHSDDKQQIRNVQADEQWIKNPVLYVKYLLKK